MDNGEHIYNVAQTFESTGDIQSDLYQIIKLEQGYFFENKYEEAMDNLAISTGYFELQFFDNYSQVLRRIKTPLKDKKISSIQKYIADKRNDLRQGFMAQKDKQHLSIALDCLEKCNKRILQLVYNIMQEIKEGVFKRTMTYSELISAYYSKRISKKFKAFNEYIEDCFNDADKTISLAYGGYNYGKKH